MNKIIFVIGVLLLVGIVGAYSESQAPSARSPILSEPTYAICNSDANDPWEFGEYPYREQSNKQGLIRVHGILRHKSTDVAGSEIGQSLSTPIGTFEWHGHLGKITSNGGSGWCLVKNPLHTQ